MKKAILLVTITAFAAILTSCKSKDKTPKQTTNTSSNTAPVDSANYRFIASFFSPGNGTDHDTKEKYDKFLLNSYPSVIYERIGWGREGEYDLCFKLSELSAKEQLKFIEKSKEILNKSDRVNVLENVPCQHKK
jgi:hypothetical protein